MSYEYLNEIIKSYLSNDMMYVKNNIFDNTTYKNKFEAIPLLLSNKRLSHELLLEIPKDKAVDDYIETYNRTTHPSTLAKFEIINDYLESHTDINIKRKINFDKYNVTTSSLDSAMTQSHPSEVTPFKMNIVDPIICGYFFEYMLGLAINSNMILNSINLIQLLENQTYMTDICNLCVELCKDSEKDSEIIINVDDFKSKYHYLLFKIFVDNRHKSENYHDLIYNILRVNELLSKPYYITELDKYIDELSKTIFVQQLKQANIKHSVKLEYISDEFDLTGESDFIGDNIIVDCKCYKNEEIDLWKYQLCYYKFMCKNSEDISALYIVNLYNNKVYKYTIDK